MYPVDLHIHSNASDGSDSPAEIVRKAAACGLKAIAITDHDTIQGVEEAVAEGQKNNLEVIRGCELSARSEYGEMHILGLWLPENANGLRKVLEELREHRNSRNMIIINKLKALGLEVSYEELLETAKGESIGRPHLASMLIKKGYVSDVKTAFERYLGPKGGAYERKKTLSPEEAVKMLHQLGATVSMAHPKLLRATNEWLEDSIARLKPYGLEAIEAYHSEHSHADERFCVELAARHNLALTGGSDYHGKTKPAISLGKGYGSLRMPDGLLEKLKKLRRKKGLPV